MTTPPQTETAEGRFAYDGLDRAIHERARLGIMTSLAAHPKGLTFSKLKVLCRLTDGNLSRHLDMLREAELVEINKSFHGKRPQTQCRLTRHGRERFIAYLATLERVVTDAAEAGVAAEAPTEALAGGES